MAQKTEPRITRSREEIQSVLIGAEINKNRADDLEGYDVGYAAGIDDFWRWLVGYTHQAPNV